jgi:hypothetical protein
MTSEIPEDYIFSCDNCGWIILKTKRLEPPKLAIDVRSVKVRLTVFKGFAVGVKCPVCYERKKFPDWLRDALRENGIGAGKTSIP